MRKPIRRLEVKHWAVIAGFLSATATMLSGLHGWNEIIDSPAAIAGLIAQMAALVTAVYVSAPPNPYSKYKRRHGDRAVRSDADQPKTPVAKPPDDRSFDQ